MFDFGALSPEINSGRMYAGPGAGPMMAAAAAWDEIAAEVGVAASGYHSVISELTGGPWVGPTSRSMVAAVTPYVGWLTAVSGQAEESAGQARAAAAAYEAAFAATVPPPVVAANRVLLANLIATNFFGQNGPAIAATEAQYAEMWAQDASAMYGYTAASAAASALPPFAAAPNTTTPDAGSGQFSAVAQAAATPANNSAQTASQLSSASSLSQASPQLAASSAVANTSSATSSTTTAATAATSTSTVIDPSWWQLVPANYTTVLKQSLQAYFGVGLANFGWSIAQQLTYGPGGETAGAGGAWFPTPQFATLGLGNLGGGAAAVSHIGGAGLSAATGQATQVGSLSVPQQWATLTSTVRTATVTEIEGTPAPTVTATGAPAVPGNAVLSGMPVGGAGRRSGAGFVHKYGFRYSVLTRPPSAG